MTVTLFLIILFIATIISSIGLLVLGVIRIFITNKKKLDRPIYFFLGLTVTLVIIAAVYSLIMAQMTGGKV